MGSPMSALRTLSGSSMLKTTMGMLFSEHRLKAAASITLSCLVKASRKLMCSKRTAFGFRRFEHYRIRSLLYAGRPNWSMLEGLTPP
jgi:hypothetical protein